MKYLLLLLICLHELEMKILHSPKIVEEGLVAGDGMKELYVKNGRKF